VRIDTGGPLVTTPAEKDLVGRAAAMAADEAAFMDDLVRYDESGDWADHGFFSCSTWLAAACGMARVTARERLRVARALRHLPGIRHAFGTGEIGYCAVRAMTRIDDPTEEMQEAMLEVARTGTVEDLEHLVRVWREYRDQERATDSMRRHEARRQGRCTRIGSAMRLDATMPVDEGEPLLAALREASGDLPGDTPFGARLVAGLLALVDHWRSTTEGTERETVTVTADADSLVGRRLWASLAGAPVPAETARRQCCDSSIVPILTRSSEPLAVGRATRKISAPLRRLLHQRDQGCVFPGCTSRHHLDGHHVRHWADGGTTEPDNLVLLCRHHHRAVHEGAWSMRVSEGEPVFVGPLGRTHSVQRQGRWQQAAAQCS